MLDVVEDDEEPPRGDGLVAGAERSRIMIWSVDCGRVLPIRNEPIRPPSVGALVKAAEPPPLAPPRGDSGEAIVSSGRGGA